MIRWSPEVRVLRDPAGTFRELAVSSGRGPWTALRRPLTLLMFLGAVVSLQSSGRISARVVADGMVSFAFLPAFEVISLGIIYYSRSDRRVPFGLAVDAFFVSNAPWLLWLMAFCIWRCFQTPMSTTSPPAMVVRTILGSLVMVMLWSSYLDWRYFQVLLPRERGNAFTSLIVQRAIGWTATIAYFLGIAIWAQIAAWLS